jgi:hypothetical protein
MQNSSDYRPAFEFEVTEETDRLTIAPMDRLTSIFVQLDMSIILSS